MRLDRMTIALFLPVVLAIGSPLAANDVPAGGATFSLSERFSFPAGLFAPLSINAFDSNAEDEDENENEDEKAQRIPGRVLILDYGFGVTDETGVDATALFQFGLNFGTPVLNDELGFQIGGNFGRREGGRFEEDLTVGFFNRAGVTTSGRSGEAAMLLDYRRTMRDADIFALRLHAGVDVSDGGNVGVRVRVPLNQEKSRRFGPFSERQRFLSRVDVLVAKEQSERVSTIFNVGYMFGDVDTVAVGLRLDLSNTRSSRFRPMFEINFDGDYVFGVEFAIDLGRRIGEHHAGWAQPGDRLYRPFPKLSFLEMVEETRRP